MSCVIKFPNKNSKGVLSLTNSELRELKNNLDLIYKLKKEWIILYHPNYYDNKFENKNIFDGYLALEETFNVIDDDKSKILNLNCHNFAPNYFEISNQKKIYDFVGLSRLQTSKGNPKNVIEFLNVVKEAMKLKANLTGILVISVPGIRPFKTNYIRSIYNRIFSEEEKKRFEFLTLDYDVPFSLSVKTLSIFYNSSKVHLNTHPKERHGRAQTYALSSGLPIVGFSNLTYLVKKEFRKEPHYFVAENINEFPNKLIKAVEYVDNKYNKLQHDDLAKKFKSINSFEELKKKIMDQFNLDNKDWNFIDDWDIRLAKHHMGYKTKNSYYQKINEFLIKLNNIDKSNFLNEDEDDINFLSNKNFLDRKIRSFNYYVNINLINSKTLVKNLLRKIRYRFFK